MRAPTMDKKRPFEEEDTVVETEQEIAKTAVRQSNFFMMFAANISVVLCILFTSDILRHDIRWIFIAYIAGVSIIFWMLNRCEQQHIISVDVLAIVQPLLFYLVIFIGVLCTGGYTSPVYFMTFSILSSAMTNFPGVKITLYPLSILVIVGHAVLLLYNLGYFSFPQFVRFNVEEAFYMQFITAILSTISITIRGTNLLKFTEAALKKEVASNKAKSRFVATVSHEMRTPLTTILGWLEVLETSQLSSDLLSKLSIIRSCSENLLTLINDLLDLSKIENGKLELLHRPFDLENVVRSTFERSKVLFNPKVDPRLIMDLPTIRNVVGDQHRLVQLLSNFLSNAAKFTKIGSVELKVEEKEVFKQRNEVELQFTVTDTGIGMNEHTQSEIFKPFVQADSSMSREYGGTGLGLTISLQIIRLMKGDVRFQSEEGVGTTFTWTVILGIYDDKPSIFSPHRSSLSFDVARQEAEFLRKIRSKPLRVLLAEDNKLNQTIVLRLLKQLYFEAEGADNGAEAVKMAQASEYDVILMDFQMPVMNGITAAQSIRTLGITTPIIGLTANADEESHKEAVSAGMVDLLIKPVHSNELKLAIEKAVDSTSSNDRSHSVKKAELFFRGKDRHS